MADIERVTGWRLPRENYSKYETGTLSPEPATLDRFIAYWRTRGVEPPDLTEPEAEAAPLSLEERAVLAAEQQAAEAAAQTDLIARQVALLERLTAKLIGSESDQAFGDLVETWAMAIAAQARQTRHVPAP